MSAGAYVGGFLRRAGILTDGKNITIPNGILAAQNVWSFEGTHRYVNTAVATSRGGLSWNRAFKTIQEAIDASSSRDVVFVAPGEYDEAVTIAATLKWLKLIGIGPRGSPWINYTTTDGTGLTVLASECEIRNIGSAGNGTGKGCFNYGDGNRYIDCVFEGEAEAFRLGMGNIAQIAAETHGAGSNTFLEGCEFKWTSTGIMVAASEYGAITQCSIRGCKFHNCSAAAITEVGAGGGVDATVQFRNLEIVDCTFDDAEGGAAPTAFILLNDSNLNDGIVSNCRFPTAVAGGLNLVSTTLHWVANRHTDGISGAQPS